jgi:hypothetical protein
MIRPKRSKSIIPLVVVATVIGLVVSIGLTYLAFGRRALPPLTREAPKVLPLGNGRVLIVPPSDPRTIYSICAFEDFAEFNPLHREGIPATSYDDSGNVSLSYAVRIKLYESADLAPEVVKTEFMVADYADTKKIRHIPIDIQAIPREILEQIIPEKLERSSITDAQRERLKACWLEWMATNVPRSK